MVKDHDRVVVDASFLIRALDPSNNTPEAPRCVQLWRGFLERRTRIIIPAVVVAELQARNPSLPTPRTPDIIVAPFDERCAEIIRKAGGTMSFADGRPKGYWKYDTLIGACVVAATAKVLVHADGDFKAIAGRFGFDEKRYDQFDDWSQTSFLL